MDKSNKVKQVYVKKRTEATKIDTSIFKQNFGESLKDAWFRIQEMHDKDPNPCSEAKLNTNFYFGLEPWGKYALDFPSGGSFMLAPFEESSLIIKKSFWH